MDNVAVIVAERLARGYMEYDVSDLSTMLHPTDVVLSGALGTAHGHRAVVELSRHLLRFISHLPTQLQSYSVVVEEKHEGHLVWGSRNLVIKETAIIQGGKIVQMHRELHDRATPPEVDKATATAMRDALIKHMDAFMRGAGPSRTPMSTPRGLLAANSVASGDMTGSSSAVPRITTHRDELPVLDLSFCDIKAPVDIVRAVPRSGIRVPTQQLVSEILPDEAALAKEQQQQQQQQQQLASSNVDDKLIVKAKNRDGEAAAYEFDRTEQRRTNLGKALLENSREDKHAQMHQIARKCGNKFMTNAVRLSSNALSGDVPMLASVLSTLVQDAFLQLTWVDLSCNELTVIPDFSAYPLTILNLHQNKISSYDEVRKLRPLPLVSLTLFGNPLDNSRTYKARVLDALFAPDLSTSPSPPPHRCTGLKKLDNVVVTRGDMKTLSSARVLGTTKRDPALDVPAATKTASAGAGRMAASLLMSASKGASTSQRNASTSRRAR